MPCRYCGAIEGEIHTGECPRVPTQDIGKPHLTLVPDPKPEEYEHNHDPVIRPKHYTSDVVECIEIVRHRPYNIGVAIAYLWREDKKNGIEDLRKALWHIEDEIKWREKKSKSVT